MSNGSGPLQPVEAVDRLIAFWTVAREITLLVAAHGIVFDREKGIVHDGLPNAGVHVYVVEGRVGTWFRLDLTPDVPLQDSGDASIELKTAISGPLGSRRGQLCLIWKQGIGWTLCVQGPRPFWLGEIGYVKKTESEDNKFDSVLTLTLQQAHRVAVKMIEDFKAAGR